MNSLHVLLIIIGIYILWNALIITVVIREKKRSDVKSKKPQHDERQLADQAVAYKAAFLTVLLYDASYIIVKEDFDFVWCEDIFGFGIGAIAGTAVFMIVCIQRDAFFRVGKQAAGENFAVLICTVCGTFTTLFMSFDILNKDKLIRNGIASAKALIVVVFLYFLLLDAAFFHQYLMRKRKTKNNK